MAKKPRDNKAWDRDIAGEYEPPPPDPNKPNARVPHWIFTTGVVSAGPQQKVALFFTGTQHAGENIRDVLAYRNQELQSPVLMCDALSRNVSTIKNRDQFLLGHCLAHGRRNFAEVADSFPAECRHVLEVLGEVYGFDRQARELRLDPKERQRFHQQHSEPVMKIPRSGRLSSPTCF